MLRVKDRDGNLSIKLMKQIAEYGIGRCPYVIVEGILVSTRYRDMLLELIERFEQNYHAYYFDLPFEETVARHQSREKKMEFGESEMRSWWNEKDFLNVPHERIIDKTFRHPEVLRLIRKDLTL